MSSAKIGIMQPYFFPYIGYFQLISAVDTFVVYDDVHFIPQGWVNRNRIVINGKVKYLTIPCKKASQNKRINEVNHDLDEKMRKKLVNKITLTYGKAPFFDEVFPLFKEVIHAKSGTIGDLSLLSIKKTMSYIGINTRLKVSSDSYDNRNKKGAERIIDICKKENASTYINPIGGSELYNKNDFSKEGINLFFLQSTSIQYDRNASVFIPFLSILDVMMFNSVSEMNRLLDRYILV